MPISQKINGVWTGIDTPWIKVDGVWKQALGVDVKDGSWKRVYSGDNQPPAAPVIQVNLNREDQQYDYVPPVTQRIPYKPYQPAVPGRTVKNKDGSTTSYVGKPAVPAVPAHDIVIRQGYYVPRARRTTSMDVYVRMPQAGTPAHDPTLRRIRVLVSTTGWPPNPNAAGFYAEPNDAGGNESWSDFYFGDNGVGIDGTEFRSGRQTHQSAMKRFMPGWAPGQFLPANTTFYFAAWAQDIAGNWSQISSNIHVGTSDTGAAYSAATILPIAVGTYDEPDKVATRVPGEARVAAGKSAYFLYGDQIKDIVPAGATIIWASARIHRAASDGGQPVAKQTGAGIKRDGTTYLGSANVPTTGSSSGGISRGQIAQKDMPWAVQSNFREDFVGFKYFLNDGDQINSVATYVSQEEDPQQGALGLAWYV